MLVPQRMRTCLHAFVVYSSDTRKHLNFVFGFAPVTFTKVRWKGKMAHDSRFNRFHVAVRLFSNRSQMTSKCCKNKKVAHLRRLPSVSLMFLPHFDVLCDLFIEQMQGNMESIFFRCLYKMKQSHWLLCVAKNCDWSRKITPLSNLTQRASRGMKTYSEGRIVLRNLQILKKIPEKSSQFLLTEQPCEPKRLDVALNTAGVERIRSENLRLT